MQISLAISPTRPYRPRSASASAPVNTVPPEISGNAWLGETLTVSSGTWENNPTGYTRQWKRDGADIVGATASTYVIVEDDIGALITATVTASNAGGSVSEDAGGVTPLGPPVFISSNAVDVPEGSPYEHILATAQPSSFAITGGADENEAVYSEPDLITLEAQTYVGGGDNTREVEVTATDDFTGLQTTDTIVFTITDVTAPVNSVAPSVSGTAIEGFTLTATPGTWSGAETVTGQWYRGASAISGATNLAYRLVTADIGSTIKYRETATNGGGSATQDSSATASVGSGVIARVAYRTTTADLSALDRWTYRDQADGTSPVTRGGCTTDIDGTAGWGSSTSSTRPQNLIGWVSGGSSLKVKINVPTGVKLSMKAAFGAASTGVTTGFSIYDGDPSAGGTLLHTVATLTTTAGSQVGDISGALISETTWESAGAILTQKDGGGDLTSSTGTIYMIKTAGVSNLYLRAWEITYAEFGVVTSGVGPFYVNPSSGDDNNAGTSTGAAWEFAPNDPNAGGVLPAFVLLPGATVNFEGS